MERLNRTLKTSLKCWEDSTACHDHLPWVLMALRNSPKDDLAGFSPNDMTLVHPIRLPGEFFDDTNGFEETDTNLFVSRFGRYVSSLRFMPPRRVNHKSHLDKALSAPETIQVYIHRDARRTPLQPVYEGPFKVLKKFAKYFVVDLRRHVDNVSIDRLKSVALSFQNLNSSHPVAENESELVEPISGAVNVDNFAGKVDSIEAGSADDFFQNDCQLPLGTHADPTPGVSSRGRPLRRPNRLQDYCVDWQ